MNDRFWEKIPLDALKREEWESLCDGCGKCCLFKLEDDDTGEVLYTNVACRLLDCTSGQCRDYRHRRLSVPECVRLSASMLGTIPWLPESCAYRLIYEGKSLPEWHYLISGDRESVHKAGKSVRGWTISEEFAGDLENHIVEHDV
ncbi:MAG: YcgN family cysteine cluster protein [Zymomonas mobilis subsp. pomaceae]|uniref:UPF0260 protein Zymop_1152 n=1 Tax=Zymomonas mobilis subsp. pomaceae (strain ATCC 29192 / DSM 22645 / JCM 10191 / CCUG 17912 / NBRC 13757 / NCIMB 11200 / NRRL B-4491 / Barker I) TaxID=579138 RepID=F8ETV0_ZYMMT|nr:YcgN family cysteine cluster protein [Zymomonas mobilis]AEI38047.1 protein of unknown function UPF0153 [Zymomonas mobilis subsp. pomaceae ATCC 29192]MDX5949413.1 YcgN family cysteine cluster protein [Zymomonas mobilis subsp. pomaceae]GEB89156.1 UPF0260 protein [Zymomonas mobilis subsp. pomaceae]